MKKGFTIMELVLILSLLGILAITAIVLAPNLSTVKLNAAARQAQSDIEYAKQRTQVTGRPTGARFVASTGSYTVYEYTVATPLKSPLTKQDMIISFSSSYPGISITADYTIEFGTFGAPTTGGGGGVTLSDGSSTKTITVTAQTGLVVIQ